MRRLRWLCGAVAVGGCLVFALVATSNGSSKEGPNVYGGLAPATPECVFGYTAVKERCAIRVTTTRPGDTLSGIAELLGDANSWKQLCVTRRYGNVEVTTPATRFMPRRLLPGDKVALCAI